MSGFDFAPRPVKDLLREIEDVQQDAVDTVGTGSLGLAAFFVQLSQLDLLFKIGVALVTIIYIGTKTVLAILRYWRTFRKDFPDRDLDDE